MMRREVSNWLEQAKADLKAAEDNIRMSNFFVSAFLSQQCAEKSIKAYYIQRKKSLPPKTHSLLEFSKLLGLSEELESKLRELSPPYFIARYPNAATGIPAEYYDRSAAERLVGLAREVLEWVMKGLKK